MNSGIIAVFCDLLIIWYMLFFWSCYFEMKRNEEILKTSKEKLLSVVLAACLSVSYFAQILEEHGPLCASDPLMVGELENFPLEAQQKITAAGGLEAFLLESLRFVMSDNVIGLMKHVVSLTDPSPAPHMSHLNPTAKEFWPQTDVLSDSGSHVHLVSFDSSAESLLSLPVTSDSILLADPYASDGPVADYQHLPTEYVSAQYRSSAFERGETRGENQTAVSVQVRCLQMMGTLLPV